MRTIYYASDIHLEFYETDEQIDREGFQEILDLFPGDSNGILILAGDIGYPWQQIFTEFLKHCCSCYCDVVYTTGNHEYYSEEFSMEQIDILIQGISHENFHALNNSSVTISGLTFIGGTLFTYYPESKYQEVSKIMNDYNYYSPEEVCKRHRETFEYLNDYINKTDDCDNIIVVTHHLPSYYGLALKYRHLSTNYLYANQLDSLLKKECVKYWICGHTHIPKIFGKLHINPFGYPGEIIRGLKKIH